MVKDVFKTNRPSLSDGSLRTYVSILKNLGKQLDISLSTPEEVIKHSKEIVAHLKEVPPKLRKTRLACLIVFIEKCDDKQTESVIKEFRECMMNDIKEYKTEVDKQELSERQKEGMMSLKDIMKKYSDLEKAVAPLMKKDKLTCKEFCHCQMYVLLSCLLLIPPRRSLDFTEFKLRNPTEDCNYMKVEKRIPYFIFNTYKTAKKYGQQKEQIPNKLASIIKTWANLNPSEYLLQNTKQTGKITPTQLTNLLHSFFERPLSTSLLRHIYLSEKYKDIPAIKDMKDTAAAMGHSLNQALEYVKK